MILSEVLLPTLLVLALALLAVTALRSLAHVVAGDGYGHRVPPPPDDWSSGVPTAPYARRR